MTTVNLNNPLSQNPANVPANSANPNIAPRPAGQPAPRVGGSPLPPPPVPRPMGSSNGQRQAPQTASGSNTGAKVAVAAGLAAVAGGGTAAAMAMMSDDPEETLEVAEELTAVEENNSVEANTAAQVPVTPEATSPSPGATPSPGAQTTNTQPVGGQIPEPELPGETAPAEPAIPAEPAEPAIPAEPAVLIDEEITIEEPVIEDPEDPNMLADASISGEEVDATEIRMDGDFAFTEVGTVYTVEGDEVTAATFRDAYDNEMVMVDLDNDGYFDYAGDEYGNVADVSHMAMSVSDAEEQVTEGYLAQSDNEIETFENEFGDDYLDDIITV